ncbi:laccase [Pholiota conissans]|uniref:Laccase n=1 Tax=Pholiota conissans TaxID=109636 RepID=A0A9P6D0I2_9AGAR|nr:laccase [Pholiota conissans]
MQALLRFLELSLVVGAYAAIGPTTNLFIENKFIQPDGFNRSAVLAGPTADSVTFPGPLITGQINGTFAINVIDELVDQTMLTTTSIHWHGFFQKGTDWADGPVGVTQCPIKPGNSFEYKFAVPGQAGTYWYHSHDSTQYCDGLRGPLVVYDPNDPYKSQYDFDDDNTVITLADWYHSPAPLLGMNPRAPTSNATLINGKGRYAESPTADLAVISVIPNKRYRFRLVSISCDPNFIFSIDKHSMIIIEVDGQNVQPLTVDSITIYAGQRYSFILHANQQTSNYWIRALTNSGPVGFTNGVNSAILRYVGALAVDPTTVNNTSNPLQEWRLQPLNNPMAPGVPKLGAADKNLNLDITFNGTFFFINNQPGFLPPPKPVLLQILSGAHDVHDLLPAGNIYELPANSVIELSLPGGSTGSPHPIHLHGHAFSVIRSAGSDVYNYNNPVRRDVVNIGTLKTDNVTIRFETDNAGPWILHCHIDWHLDRGLDVVFAEDIPGIVQQNPPSEYNLLAKCSSS